MGWTGPIASKPEAKMKIAVLIVLLLAFVSPPVFAADGNGRYQFGGTDHLKVIDSQTGAVWAAKTDGNGHYIMVPVPFQSPDGKSLTLTPPKSN